MSSYLKNSLKRSDELHFSGICSINESSFVAGKVFIWRANMNAPVPETPIICSFDSAASSELESFVCQSYPSALVISSSALSSRLLNIIVSAKIPYLILKDTPPILFSQDGKIALLDTKRNILIVNPALETLNAYPQSASEDSISTSLYGELRLIKEQKRNRFLLDAPYPIELFDSLTEASEKLGAPPITLILSVPRSKSEEELFCENTEALFRSAVYGDLSVMLKDYVTDTELSYAFSLMHKVFCRLQEEGREFNGYIKKGLLINSPSYLMRSIRLQRPDFLCFELDALLCRIFGCPSEHLIHSSDVRQTLRAIWERYLDCFAPECSFWLKSRELEETELLRDFISFARIRDIYIDKS